jgi:hypothetical protein
VKLKEPFARGKENKAVDQKEIFSEIWSAKSKDKKAILLNI